MDVNVNIIIDGVYLEIKSPQGKGKNTIKHNLQNADKQSENVIIDLHCCGLDDEVAVNRINDSMNELGAHKDRHAKLGEGHIGNGSLSNVIRHPLLQDKPFILETPNDDAGYAKEIALVKDIAG